MLNKCLPYYQSQHEQQFPEIWMVLTLFILHSFPGLVVCYFLFILSACSSLNPPFLVHSEETKHRKSLHYRYPTDQAVVDVKKIPNARRLFLLIVPQYFLTLWKWHDIIQKSIC